MTARGANPQGARSETRSGAETLALLADPLNRTILTELAEGPKRLVDLRRESGAAPQTTVRAHLKAMEVSGIATLQGRPGAPQSVEWALTDPGRDLVGVMEALEQWLQKAPEEPMVFDSDAAKMAIKALVGGWSSTIMWALAAGPLSLSQMASAINQVSYPSLERRLSAMRLTGQLEIAEAEGRGTPYMVTEWLQRGVTPLAAAVRWERSHFPDETPPVTRIDAEAALLLALPLLDVPPELKGACRMGVEDIEEDCDLCGAIANVEKGKVASCTVDVDGRVDAWTDGPTAAWAGALTGTDGDGLEVGGDEQLAGELLGGLRVTLFGAEPSAN